MDARRDVPRGGGSESMMDTCEVLIVGGGPAGSACAWRLRHAGLDVLVLDKATFPRDKVCAGWITPAVLAELDIDPDVYRDGRVLQPITGFRTGLIGGGDIETLYGRTVSFGIRRCEFDQYLLQRAGARLGTGMPVTSLRRSGDHWIVNERVRTTLVVGAGGHFCPVARVLNGHRHEGPIVAAQEIEFPLSAGQASSCRVSPETPELYFCSDLQGYGWCFRKQGFLNVGLGRRDRHHLSSHVHEFVDFLQARRRIPLDIPTTWRGHAYRLFESMPRAVLDDGIVLIGDAAGLAYPESGEGIRPGIESGLMAAGTILAARGRYDRDHLAPYQRALHARFRRPTWPRVLTAAVPPRLVRSAATWLLTQPWFARRVVLDRWFLHTSQPALEPQNGLPLIQPSERRTWRRAS